MAISPLVPDRIGSLKFPLLSNFETGIVATASGNQSTAYQLGAQINRVDTVASGSDSVKLPKIVASPGQLSKTGASRGASIVVTNNGANAMQLFGGALDTINGVTSATGIAVSAGVTLVCFAVDLNIATGVGTWVATAAAVAIASGTISGVTISSSTFTTGNTFQSIPAGDSNLDLTGQAAAQGGQITLTGGTSSTSANAGGAITLTGGTPGATGVGGAIVLVGAIGGATSGAGGAVSVTGGAGTNGNAAGGAASLIGGLGQGSAAGGAITITSGAAGATGVAGAVNISVGAATAGAGSAMTLTAGNGAGGTAAGGNINLVPGTAVSTGVPGELLVNSVSGLFDAVWQQYLPASVPVSGSSYTFFMANRAYRVKAASCSCSSTSTVPTVDVIKDTGTTAPGGGTSVLTGVMTFSATANTRVTGTPSSTVATVTMAAGDRLSTKWAGTVGSITGAIVSVLLEPV